MNAIALLQQPATSTQHPIPSCHWRTQRSEVKNLSNVETDESDYECDRTPPTTRPLHPTPNLVILNAAKRSEESPPMLRRILSL